MSFFFIPRNKFEFCKIGFNKPYIGKSFLDLSCVRYPHSYLSNRHMDQGWDWKCILVICDHCRLWLQAFSLFAATFIISIYILFPRKCFGLFALPLGPEHCRQQIVWSKEKVEWNVGWKPFMYSDESIFCWIIASDSLSGKSC